MKELSIEQKARAYDEAIERARYWEKNPTVWSSNDICQKLFPELSESDDERIVKELLTFFRESIHGGHILTNKEYDSWIAWLEKQGEQKLMNEKSLYKAGYLDGFEDGVRDAIIKEDEQKPAWSEEDESKLKSILFHIEDVENKDVIDWFKSLKDRVQSRQEWKQENIEELSDFENVMMHIGDSFFGQYAGLDPNDTNTIKEQATILLGLVPKQDWSEENEKMLKDTICFCELCGNQVSANWLKSLRPPYYCDSCKLKKSIEGCHR